jgi:hypothetical protein
LACDSLITFFFFSYHDLLRLSILSIIGIDFLRLVVSFIVFLLRGFFLSLWNLVFWLAIKYLGIGLVAFEGDEGDDEEDKNVEVINVEKNHLTRYEMNINYPIE